MFRAIVILLFFILVGPSVASTSVTWNGSSYTVPEVGEEGWFGEDKVDGLLVDLATNGFQKTGGSFVLTSEADFGGTAGVVGLYFGTRSSSDSTSGVFRLANTESIGWRNAANSANLLLTVDSSNNLSFNGTPIASSSGVVPVSAGGTGISSYAVGDLIYVTPDVTTIARLPVGTTSYLLKSNGTTPVWGQVVNASVDSSAAIDRSKLATGTASHVVINSGAGAFSSEATLAVSRGGTNTASYSTGDLLYASAGTTLSKLTVGTSGQVLKSNGTTPEWGAAGASLAVATKTADYLLTSNDDLVVVSPTTGLVIAMLPQASANAGKVFHIKRDSISQTHIARVSPASGDTIGNYPYINIGASNGWVSVVSDGGTIWRIIDKRISPTQSRYTSGTGTYTPSPGVLYIQVEMAGGGGGGSGSANNTNTGGNGGNGGNTTFGTSLLTANGGTGGVWGNGGATAGGTATISSPAFGSAFSGGTGGGQIASNSGTDTDGIISGGAGGGSLRQGGISGSSACGAAVTNGGGGGSGAPVNTGTPTSGTGTGGGGGGNLKAIIFNPLSTGYAYSIGSAGTAGSAGTGGAAGCAGAAGYIEVTEFY